MTASRAPVETEPAPDETRVLPGGQRRRDEDRRRAVVPEPVAELARRRRPAPRRSRPARPRRPARGSSGSRSASTCAAVARPAGRARRAPRRRPAGSCASVASASIEQQRLARAECSRSRRRPDGGCDRREQPLAAPLHPVERTRAAGDPARHGTPARCRARAGASPAARRRRRATRRRTPPAGAPRRRRPRRAPAARRRRRRGRRSRARGSRSPDPPRRPARAPLPQKQAPMEGAATTGAAIGADRELGPERVGRLDLELRAVARLGRVRASAASPPRPGRRGPRRGANGWKP